MFKGSIPALVTPMANGAVDIASFEKLVNWQIESGSHGLVPVGTTGESPTLTHEEHRTVVKACIAVADGRVPVIAGAGSNSTAEAVELAKFAQDAGANGVLCVAPYYNKPSQEGLFQHFKTIADAVSIPLIVYNIPPRSVVDISNETMKRIYESCENMIGVKDATTDLGRVLAHRHEIGPDFVQLSGEDPTAVGYNAQGGVGCISVTANIAPALCAKMQQACLDGDYVTALSVQDKLSPLHRALFLEPSPAGPKYALSKLGICGQEMRLPLVSLSPASQGAVDAAMAHAGLI